MNFGESEPILGHGVRTLPATFPALNEGEDGNHEKAYLRLKFIFRVYFFFQISPLFRWVFRQI